MRWTFLPRALLALLLAIGPSFAPAFVSVGHAQFSAAPAPAYLGAMLFGTGADGNVTISSGTTTLTRDMHYANLTLTGTGAINPAGWRIYVRGVLDLSTASAGAIVKNGINGNSASGATAGLGQLFLDGPVGYAGNGNIPQAYSGSVLPTGGAGTTGVGSSGGAAQGAGAVVNVGGNNGASGAGGSSTSAGGAATAQFAMVGSTSPFATPNAPIVTADNNQNTTYKLAFGGIFGNGGGAGGGDGTNQSGGGGAGSVGGGEIAISAFTIQRGTNSTANIISAIGGVAGNGGNAAGGNSGGGGGGSGGGGGFVHITVGYLLGSTITNGINVSGGNGGSGGGGQGTGKGGNGGNGGNGGMVQIVLLNPASYTQSTWNIAGGVGSTTLTATGAASGAGAVQQANL
jgi:hypothetical protein